MIIIKLSRFFLSLRQAKDECVPNGLIRSLSGLICNIVNMFTCKKFYKGLKGGEVDNAWYKLRQKM
jgi:hypothetical protein